MHEATVTASAVRQDKTAFKATLPVYGEVWLKLADSDVGKIEWKKTYDIAFTVKPAKNGGNFFDVKRIGNPSLPQEAFKPNVPALNGGADRTLDVGPHVGMWEKEVFSALLSGKTSAEVILLGIEARQVAREILKTDLSGKLPGLNESDDDLENTF